MQIAKRWCQAHAKQNPGRIGRRCRSARGLTSQKEEIAAAMPSGLSRLLEESGVHEAIASASTERRTYDRPPGSYDAPRTASMHRMANDTKTSMRSMNWLYWVLPLISLGALL